VSNPNPNPIFIFYYENNIRVEKYKSIKLLNDD
jgi:hypothetical protein